MTKKKNTESIVKDIKRKKRRWLVKKRLDEANFLNDKKSKRSNDIYVDLGFESLSHFSVAFKKQFGQTPTQLSTDSNI